MSLPEPVTASELYEFVRKCGPVNTERIVLEFSGRASPVKALHRLRVRGFVEVALGAWTSTSRDSFDMCVAREHLTEAARILDEQGDVRQAMQLLAIANHLGTGRARWMPQIETKEARE